MSPRWKDALFTPLQVVLTLLLFVEAAAIYGVAAAPAAWLWLRLEAWLPLGGAARLLALCVAAAGAWFLFGLTLLAVIPLARWLTFALGTPVGRFPFLSLGAWRWASYNALTLMLRFTFVNWIRVTPFLPLYHRLMGMRVGRRVQFNTAVVADQNLLEVGDDSVIGGDVTLICHSAERGRLVTAPTRIGRGVTVGLMAVILPGCTIGDGAVIAAGSVLMKGTRVGPGEVWAGSPARRLGGRRRGGARPGGVREA
ncbi:MAG TPA: DapH/DapD/GlmU-related protein [Anaeromyxobacteraceae bacterium]|jgi:acetyltransferase-like isoleucine patch superfamily enzyme